jgi:DHA1 family tetracycline resistance protein-like MFS transporter
MGYRYNWDVKAVSLLLAGVGVCQIVVNAVLVRPVVKTLGERHTILVALVAGTLGFTIQAMAANGAFYAVGIVVMSLWGLLNPALQGLMTRLVSPAEQGRLQGANGSVLGVATLIGPLLFTQTFATFIGAHRDLHLPGAPFLLSAVLLVSALAVALRVMSTSLQRVPAANS